ncbi:beta-ketoacyl synthase N-terminal-like domain-containing protein [Pontimicrobium sp. SW4]|uniref:Beta-ketoacyl synthase N-terminal-like domain-containing protein n=1 Tax=Pontimicrobium sp. SW4 TaxID=3153519 RepID=A0AAU7BS67_9FLAO
MHKPISITAISSISPLGNNLETVWKNYQNKDHCFTEKKFSHGTALVAAINDESKKEIEKLRISDNKYKSLDNSVLYAILASRNAIKKAQWNTSDNFGINIGSSRGATALFETYHKEFLQNNKANTLSSPTTTLGNISSWVAHDLQTKGPEISHSITCSTALHALLNGIAWINSGMTDKFLIGGSEAPLTSFTVAQMQALKIYSKGSNDYPCKALDLGKKHNSIILGEGASVASMEKGRTENALAIIEGFGYATEVLEHNVSLSTDAECFQKSMSMALGNLSPNDIDIIVTHTPGTIKGDQAEVNAIEKIFCNKIPALTTNKWKVGHTLGSSGMLSIEFAILMLQKQQFVATPFFNNNSLPKSINRVLVNAVGFGGNAVSIILSI